MLAALRKNYLPNLTVTMWTPEKTEVTTRCCLRENRW